MYVPLFASVLFLARDRNGQRKHFAVKHIFYFFKIIVVIKELSENGGAVECLEHTSLRKDSVRWSMASEKEWVLPMAERFLREDALRVEQDLPIDRASTVIFFLQREKTDRRIPAGPFSFLSFLFVEPMCTHRYFNLSLRRDPCRTDNSKFIEKLQLFF